jgi:protein-disulfide isomerase-like protein with CxxC motif
MTPDHNRDVVVHHFTAVDALTGETIGDRWTVWVGRESEGAFDSESDALIAARELAASHGVPAWLAEEGSGLVPLAVEP